MPGRCALIVRIPASTGKTRSWRGGSKTRSGEDRERVNERDLELLEWSISISIARDYLAALSAGLERCERIGEPLSWEQRFELLTAGQFLLGNWSLDPGTDNPPLPSNGWENVPREDWRTFLTPKGPGVSPALLSEPNTGSKCGTVVGQWVSHRSGLERSPAVERSPAGAVFVRPVDRISTWNPAYGAAQESNLPSRGLHDRTGFEDRLGHRARAAPGSA